MDWLIHIVQTLDPLLIYLLLFSMAFLENLFPPSPSDMMIVLGGALVGIGRVGFAEALLASTAGSVSGFMVMYKIGDWFGDHILEQGKISFIKIETIHKVEEWFRRHGYWVIVVNRFLTGTRAVVSFFAGMSEMKFPLTILLCAVSALVWNAMLVTSGYLLGQNWQEIEEYLNTYSRIVMGVAAVAITGLAVYYIWKKRSAEAKAEKGKEVGETEPRDVGGAGAKGKKGGAA